MLGHQHVLGHEPQLAAIGQRDRLWQQRHRLLSGSAIAQMVEEAAESDFAPLLMALNQMMQSMAIGEATQGEKQAQSRHRGAGEMGAGARGIAAAWEFG